MSLGVLEMASSVSMEAGDFGEASKGDAEPSLPVADSSLGNVGSISTFLSTSAKNSGPHIRNFTGAIFEVWKGDTVWRKNFVLLAPFSSHLTVFSPFNQLCCSL